MFEHVSSSIEAVEHSKSVLQRALEPVSPWYRPRDHVSFSEAPSSMPLFPEALWTMLAPSSRNLFRKRSHSNYSLFRAVLCATAQAG